MAEESTATGLSRKTVNYLRTHQWIILQTEWPLLDKHLLIASLGSFMGDIATSYFPHDSFVGGTYLFCLENSSPYFCESDHLHVKFGTLDNIVVIGRSVCVGGRGWGGQICSSSICRTAYYSSVAFLLTLDICFLHSLPTFGIWDHIG